MTTQKLNWLPCADGETLTVLVVEITVSPDGRLRAHARPVRHLEVCRGWDTGKDEPRGWDIWETLNGEHLRVGFNLRTKAEAKAAAERRLDGTPE